MRETTSDERHDIMREVLEEQGVPYSFDAMVDAYKEYTKRSHMLRHDDAAPEHMGDVEKMSQILADMTAENFIYDYPALRYLFKNLGF